MRTIIAHNADLIIPQIWLGNYESAKDAKFIRDKGITVVVNCTKDLPFLPLPGVYKYRVPVDDNLENSEILSMCQWINRILPIIAEHYQKGRSILIHCYAGMQRSAIVTLLYLYLYQFHDPIKSYDLIRAKRPIAFTPSMNFRHCLLQKIKALQPRLKHPF